jgi:hypothetical protein
VALAAAVAALAASTALEEPAMGERSVAIPALFAGSNVIGMGVSAGESARRDAKNAAAIRICFWLMPQAYEGPAVKANRGASMTPNVSMAAPVLRGSL